MPTPAAWATLISAVHCAAAASPLAAVAPPPGLADVALGKPVLETFSGSGAAVTSASADPPVGWFSTAFAPFNNKALFPETLLLDLGGVFNISGLAFAAPPPPAPFAPPAALSLWVSVPGVPAWAAVALPPPPSLSFPPVAARLVRLVVTSVSTPGPNFTLSVGRLHVWGDPTPLPQPPVAWPPPPRPPQPPRPAQLRAERCVEPIDVDTGTPLLSWALESSRQGERVTAWQVQARRSGGGETIFDTGVVPGSAFSVQAAPSPPLRAGDVVQWAVRLWDADGAPTRWANASFSVTKLGPLDWVGQWVGGDKALVTAGDFGPGHPAVYLRGTFRLPAPPVRAVAAFSGLGWGRLFVNGARASPLELSPGYTTYEYRTQYNVIDVTALLAAAAPGPVVLAAVLGDGWYALARDSSCCASFQHQRYVNSTRMLLDVDLWFADGSHIVVGSNASWEWALGEITSSHFNGESVDKGRALPPDWASGGGAAAPGPPPWGAWRPVALLDGPPAIFPGSVLTAQKEPPTVAAPAPLAPQAVRVAPEPNGTGSVHVVDFGAELQGRVVVTAAAAAPAWLRIIVCGSFYLTRAFTCDEFTQPSLNNGDGPGLHNFSLAGSGANETYEPLFAYAAIRRVVVHAPVGVTVLGVATRRVAMEQPRAGAFETSSDTYDWLHEALVRTQLNYVTGFPNDPSRERVGYTQDVENMFRGIAFDLASSERMYARWAQDMADGQADAYLHPGSGIPPGPGQMPTVIPGPKSDQANGVFWGGMMVWLPWRHYLHFGDERVLTRFYDNMAAYVAYLNASAPGHLVDWGLADWNSPLPVCSGWGFANATKVINTPGLYRLAKSLGDVAAFLGRPADAAALAALAAATAAAHNSAFLNASNGEYSKGAQCHQAMALAMEGLVPDAQRAAAVAALRRRVAEEDNTTLTVGFVSFLHLVLVLADEDPALLHALVTRRNYGDAAFTAACVDKDGPGGSPSTWPGCAPGPYSNSVGAFPSSDLMKESWQGADAVMPSLSGPLLLHSWHTLAGIRAADDLAGAGFRNFSILPSPVPGLSWVRAHHDAPLGRIGVEWFVAGGAFYMQAELPPGAAAQVGLPCDPAAHLFEGAALRGEGVERRAGRAFVKVGAGRWAWNCTLSPQFR